MINGKETEKQFGEDLDACLNGKAPASFNRPKEYQALLQLGERLAAADLGSEDHKEGVQRRLLQPTASRKAGAERKRNKFPKGLAVAAAFVLLIGVLFAQPSFASGLLQKFVSTISLGHITAFQVEPPPEDASYPVPESLVGQLFDKDDQVLFEVNGKTGPMYTADGEEIEGIENGEIVTKAEAEAKLKEGIRTLTDPAALDEYTNFKVGLPSYLPDGYAFDRAEQYVDEQGNTSPKYIDLYFTKGDSGKQIHIQERYADEETAYDQSTSGTIESAKVNGVDAVIINEKSIDWEADGILYSVMTKRMGEPIEKSELIKIAESVK
ncbi:uncharacterized protein DUF4367 [Fontibacillus phaseoli]|uniref:Uncharacterized protein DUF4367 n=1 Tax=Fontibacillus phaseoli TaxID=1416533 RepID=A0A369B9E5_9BACL|nr:DUF4367 domain-containing protein [Fontibacillus phaseoli]RCX18140.1 uncharacterized protein DUF4367 [Fontibacillus phaseoli]